MGMLHFLTEILILLCSPISLIAGLVLGFLFHKEMRKLGWGLLFFVVPSLDSLSPGSQGALYDGAGPVHCCLVPDRRSYLLLEQRLYSRSHAPAPLKHRLGSGGAILGQMDHERPSPPGKRGSTIEAAAMGLFDH